MKYVIYTIAFLEGFTTLSVEIVALRSFTPIVGTNSVSTSIVLGVILLALSYGYYIGGRISASGKSIEKRLIVNLLVSSLYYFFITFLVIKALLQGFLDFTDSYFFSILFSSILLFFIPVFLASQTIPLLGELLHGKHSGEKMGKLLFYSTVGSFMGSVGTAMILFPMIGVFKAGMFSSVLLSLCAFLASFFLIKNQRHIKLFSFIILLFFICFIVFFNNKNNALIYEKANAYHSIKVYDAMYSGGLKRILSLDGAYSSGIDLDTKNSFFQYIIEVNQQVQLLKPKNILVIGAAGFTFPNDIAHYDFVENIDVVDVDSSLKNIAEEFFLEKTLSPKIHFHPVPSRYFLNNIGEKKYDLILVDAYSGKSIPPQVLTYEFFEQLEKVGTNIYLNIILDTDLNSIFSKNLFTTLIKSFQKFSYKDVNEGVSDFTNIIVTNTSDDSYQEIKEAFGIVYTDDKNSIETDLFKLNR